MEKEKDTICKNCNYTFLGNYCNQCGQKVIDKRNTLKHFFQLLFSSLDIHKGLLFTIKMLFVNPGKIINEYLDGRTKDYLNPLKYLFIIVGLSTLLTIWSNAFDSGITTTNELFDIPDESTRFQAKIMAFMKKYLNIFTILFIPFYSIISRWLLKKHKQFYAEHLIINSYLYAQYALIYILPLFIVMAFPFLLKYLYFIGIIIFVSYYSYALKSIYKISLLNSIFKAILVSVLGMLIMMVVSMSLMILFLLLMKLSGANLEQLLG